jgi:hypothetical protein
MARMLLFLLMHLALGGRSTAQTFVNHFVSYDVKNLDVQVRIQGKPPLFATVDAKSSIGYGIQLEQIGRRDFGMIYTFGYTKTTARVTTEYFPSVPGFSFRQSTHAMEFKYYAHKYLEMSAGVARLYWNKTRTETSNLTFLPLASLVDDSFALWGFTGSVNLKYQPFFLGVSYRQWLPREKAEFSYFHRIIDGHAISFRLGCSVPLFKKRQSSN